MHPDDFLKCLSDGNVQVGVGIRHSVSVRQFVKHFIYFFGKETVIFSNRNYIYFPFFYTFSPLRISFGFFPNSRWQNLYRCCCDENPCSSAICIMLLFPEQSSVYTSFAFSLVIQCWGVSPNTFTNFTEKFLGVMLIASANSATLLYLL